MRRIPQPGLALAIADLARRQHGSVTRPQLLALGLSSAAIGYRVKTSRLFPVHFGVYSVGKPPATPLERAGAAVLACGPGAALSHGSAMTLWSFWKRWETPFEVSVAADRRPRGIKVHRSPTLTRRDLRTQLGIRVTSPARTVWDCAPGLSDDAPPRVLNDALLSSYLQRGALAELIERFPRHPAAPRLRPFTDSRDGPTRAGWEDAFPAFCQRFGLPQPRMAARIGRYTVDALFEAEKLIVELDGYESHSGRAAFENDRTRDADTLADGFATVRITWERIQGAPDREARRLHAILRARRARAA